MYYTIPYNKYGIIFLCMSGKESFLPRVKQNLASGARAFSATVIVGGFSAGFNPNTEVHADPPKDKPEAHLVLEESPYEDNLVDLDFSELTPDISTEDADKIVMTAFVAAYMIGMWAQVRKNLEIARPNEKRFGWVGVAAQSLAATYAIARIWDVDFGDNQEDLDKAAITGFILGYIGTKGALTLRGMSNGLPWTKAIAETGFGVEAAAGAYGIARVTELIK